MKVSDYIADFLVKQGVRHLFLISGGGMMHLLDSVGKNGELDLVCNLNEQASSICADAYAQIREGLGACMVTTGPGGTNAVTGVAASYLDSNPVLVVSGQCKTADSAQARGVRQFGAQEVDIVSVVKPITKYAVRVTEKASIRYHLEKAAYLATHGRKGPVWVDVPLDIQAGQVEPEELIGYEPAAVPGPSHRCRETVRRFYELLAASRRPAILIGAGVPLSGAREEIRELVHTLQIPVLATWRAKDIFLDEDPLYFGAPGIPATRYSNYVLQNCDLLLILGARLNPVLTAYDEPHFAFQARKVIVDIDENEIKKLDMEFEETLVEDCRRFLLAMLPGCPVQKAPPFPQWLSFCRHVKERYDLSHEKQPFHQENLVDGYLLARTVSEHSPEGAIWSGSSSGRSCGISHMAVRLKKGQRFISALGLGSMGFTLPAAIGACLAGNRAMTLALEGDGSLQHNIQELKLLSTYGLPIKLFVLSNEGYASIYMMQRNNFQGRFYGCVPDTQVQFPALKEIAAAYSLEYLCIGSDQEAEAVVKQALSHDRPVICEVFSSVYFDEIPKSMTIAHPDGTFSSSSLERLYPFLPEEEEKANMPDWNSIDKEAAPWKV